jgi:hypothetical protein
MSNFAELSQVNLSPGENAMFLVRWRGRQEGPYSAELIEKKLAANQIGLLHEILRDSRWVTIRDFLIEQEAALRVKKQIREEQEREAVERERRERDVAERTAKEREEESRTALLAEERRRNDLLAAGLERQSNASHAWTHPQIPLRPHRSGTILALAIIGLFVFGFLCLIAWIMGSGDLREMDAGRMDSSGRSTTSAGRTVGILGTILWAAGVLFLFSR